MKESLKEYIPEFGLYTMIVSDETGKKAVDTQNEWLKEYLTADKLPDELTLSMKYNQVNIRYSLNSVYNGTANTVASYLGQAGFHTAATQSQRMFKKQYNGSFHTVWLHSCHGSAFIYCCYYACIKKYDVGIQKQDKDIKKYWCR